MYVTKIIMVNNVFRLVALCDDIIQTFRRSLLAVFVWNGATLWVWIATTDSTGSCKYVILL